MVHYGLNFEGYACQHERLHRAELNKVLYVSALSTKENQMGTSSW